MFTDNYQKAKMKTQIQVAVVAIVIGALLPLEALQPQQLSAQTLFGSRAQEKTIRVDGRDRTYYVYVLTSTYRKRRRARYLL